MITILVFASLSFCFPLGFRKTHPAIHGRTTVGASSQIFNKDHTQSQFAQLTNSENKFIEQKSSQSLPKKFSNEPCHQDVIQTPGANIKNNDNESYTQEECKQEKQMANPPIQCTGTGDEPNCICPSDDLDPTYTKTQCEYNKLSPCNSDTTPSEGCKCTGNNHPTNCACPLNNDGQYTKQQCDIDLQQQTHTDIDISLKEKLQSPSDPEQDSKFAWWGTFIIVIVTLVVIGSSIIIIYFFIRPDENGINLNTQVNQSVEIKPPRRLIRVNSQSVKKLPQYQFPLDPELKT
ncbi:MAG: hypothetical protein EZS28_025631 [Streblomastix strix]|uniref:EGF-like domain-containing protein n=1 Tax=Streblomastix strix TaxID=222440 RepID=A0A5J4V8L8_9EUKA|nr:MAG: hypothetical protein EZS28_025631 [Streblomastix strix]